MTEKPQCIMIFGAGVNQLELIRAAHKLGVTSVVLDPSPDPPGRRLADHFYRVGGDDYETTREIAIRHNIRGIVTGQMEKPLRLMARLAQELNFIFHSPEVLERSLDKWKMKEAFLKKGVPCARGKLFPEGVAVTGESLSSFAFPLIMKPEDAFSSRGVFRVDSFEGIDNYIEETRSFSSHRNIIIEEFMEGKEYSVETITFRGTTTVIQFTEKFITPYPTTVELGHLQPAGLNETEKEEITDVVVRGIEALGIDNSAAHAEVIMTSAGPKIVEIGARLGGDFISSYLTTASTGISMDMAAIQVALGKEPDLRTKHSRYSCVHYLELPPGKRIKKIEPVDDLEGMPGFIRVFLFMQEGEVIQPVTHSAMRAGCVIIFGNTRREVIDRRKMFINMLLEKFEFE